MKLMDLCDEVMKRIEGADLRLICAFRMAALDIRCGRFTSAASRIRQDLDKVTEAKDRELLRAFVYSVTESHD